MSRPVFHCNDKTGAVHHECPACGEKLPIEFPTTANDWLEKLKAFAEKHATCRPARRAR